MFRSLLTFCALLVLGAASVAADPQAVPADTVITLQRGGCEKRCAVYKIVVFADGTLIYHGQHYVRKNGVVLQKVDGKAIAQLVADFQAIDYFNLAGRYGHEGKEGCSSVLSDAPVAMTSIVTGGKSKSVIHDHRCVGTVPAQLAQLEAKIDKLANSVRWIR